MHLKQLLYIFFLISEKNILEKEHNVTVTRTVLYT